ncbi:hypothetical protein T440DRAFT_485944 [Plenodomus tracheiphilus IPT5]|uniref:NADH dehydrogenase [ubiquinone] 1 beta subcomplex subunit 11, mitochondrial n=1 Tax=Plenodomus tracheiphilus IPT5 TaxID=1408161 RepID=A0A6A7BMX8_9PLEO|nr:hypothetical protein T440DRAFT_485944 [Plenodomus tracheiphilus IPT5]
MLKRKLSTDLSGPHVSIYDDDPVLARRCSRKRLFRTKSDKQQRTWTPAKERDMSELLEYILKHEEAFQNQHRLPSLYADFGQQLEVNPDGYHANIAVWIKALTDASRAGVISMQGNTHDLLNIRATDELARALQHPQHGKPTCLPAVFNEAVQKKEMIPLKDFVNSKESIYKNSWVPSPWKVLQWSLRQVGVLGHPQQNQLATGNFVVVKNVEVAADEILKKMRDSASTADRVLSKADFLKRFSNTLNPASPLTTNDLEILLVFLARDKRAISYNAQTIKFKPEHEAVPRPVTTDDTAIANLRDTLANINGQLVPLMEKIAYADAAAREAVASREMVRAKAALRSKKITENVLARRTELAHQLETVYNDLQQAADQVEIVGAMRAGAAALKSLNEQVGGAEGVQGVVDAVNEHMAHTDEITNVINETGVPIDMIDIDDEFEALERAEMEKQNEAMPKTPIAEPSEREQRLSETEAQEKHRADIDAQEQRRAEREMQERRRQFMAARAQVRAERAREDQAEQGVDETSADLSKLSFVQESEDEMEDGQEKKRVPSSVPQPNAAKPSRSRQPHRQTLHSTALDTSQPHHPYRGNLSTLPEKLNTIPSATPRAPMQSLRSATRASRILAATIRTPASSLRFPTRAFSQSQIVKGGHGHSYDPPSGWLFGVKPGEQYEKEGWEGPMFWGFGGCTVFVVVAYAFKPDTSIQTWALEEARRRLEAEGILVDPDTVKKE